MTSVAAIIVGIALLGSCSPRATPMRRILWSRLKVGRA